MHRESIYSAIVFLLLKMALHGSVQSLECFGKNERMCIIDMKKWKRGLALAGAVFLLVIFCLPMYFALTGNFSMGTFMASLMGAFFAAFMAYAMWLVYRALDKRRSEKNAGKIKYVIFDVGRVLVDFNWEEYLKGFGFPKEEEETIAREVFKSDIWNERDRGLYSEEEYVRQFVEKAPQYKKDIRRVVRESGKTIVTRDYADTWVKYLKKRGYHTYVLSNYSQYMLEQTRNKLTFLKYMDGIVFSCEVKELKPEPEIYKVLLDTYGLDPEECVFIDDRKENCTGAQKLGLHTVHFRDFKQAAEALERLGVK